MGFNKVYKSLQDLFPEIDNRVLRAVALENRKDADAAAEVVLTKVIPHFIARSTHSASSGKDMDAVQSPKDGDELEVENSEGICDHLVVKPEALNPCLKKESNGPEAAASCEPEPSIPIDDLFTLKMKEAMSYKMQSVVNLMKAVEVEESAAEQAKKEAANSGLEILKRVDELNGALQHAKEANYMHSGEVYCEKAVLIIEVKELQSRILRLSEQKDTSLVILDEICENLEGRLDAARRDKEGAEKNILEKENQVKEALAEKQLLMLKVVQENNFLKLLEEENSKIRKFLLDRGHVVDILQEEISLLEKGVNLLKEKFDGLLPLSKSHSFSHTTTCNSSASSSSLKSMAPEEHVEEAIVQADPSDSEVPEEQVEEAIVQADPSETSKKTNHVADYQAIVEVDQSESTTGETNNPWAYLLELPLPLPLPSLPLDAEPMPDDDYEDLDDEWELCDIEVI